MADKVKEDDPVTVPNDSAARVTDSTAGAVTAKVSEEARPEQKSSGPQTVNEQFQQFVANIAKLGGVDKNGKFDVPDGLYSDRTAAGNGPKTLSDARGSAGSEKTVAAFKPGEKPQANEVTDGRINVPADASAEVKDQVARLNRHMNDSRNGLSADQKADLELSTEQLISNKNPDGSKRNPPIDANEIPKVLAQANRMFDRTDAVLENGFTKENRNLNVVAMVHDIARPLDAGQGLNNACLSNGVGKVETYVHPSEQARRNVDMYTGESQRDGKTVKNIDEKGKFVEMGGKKVYYDVESVAGDREAAYAAQHHDGTFRDAYMQGVTHLNANFQTQKRGEFYCERRTSDPGDTGERLKKGSFNGPNLMEPLPKDAQPGDKPKPVMNPRLTGDDAGDLQKALGLGSVAIDFQGMGIKPPHGSNMMNVDAGAKGSLDRAWAANGGKPMTIAVDSNAAMFIDAAGGGKGGGHVVMVSAQRTNEKTGEKEYFLHNWGEKNSGWVNGDALQSSMNIGKGDRSGVVPITSPGDQQSANSSDRVLTRPPAGERSAPGGGGSQTDYEGGNGAKRDPNGILVREQRESEMHRREQLDRDQKDAQEKDRKDAELKTQERDAQAREERARKDLEDQAKRDAARKKEKEAEAKELLENDPNNPKNAKKKKGL